MKRFYDVNIILKNVNKEVILIRESGIKEGFKMTKKQEREFSEAVKNDKKEVYIKYDTQYSTGEIRVSYIYYMYFKKHFDKALKNVNIIRYEIYDRQNINNS